MTYQGLVPKLVLEGPAPTYTLYTEKGCTVRTVVLQNLWQKCLQHFRLAASSAEVAASGTWFCS